MKRVTVRFLDDKGNISVFATDSMPDGDAEALRDSIEREHAQAGSEWGREDSNLRRLSRRVYSPFPLATRAHPRERVIVASSPRPASPRRGSQAPTETDPMEVTMAPKAPDFPSSRTFPLATRAHPRGRQL